jgi:hypothetical protein
MVRGGQPASYASLRAAEERRGAASEHVRLAARQQAIAVWQTDAERVASVAAARQQSKIQAEKDALALREEQEAKATALAAEEAAFVAELARSVVTPEQRRAALEQRCGAIACADQPDAA